MSATTDATTTACPLEWAKWKIACAAYDLFAKNIEQASYSRLLADRRDVETRAAAMDALYKPSRSTRIGFSKSWEGTAIPVLP